MPSTWEKPLATSLAFLQPSDFRSNTHLFLITLRPLGGSTSSKTLCLHRESNSLRVTIFRYFSFLFPSHDCGKPDSYLPSLYGRVELHNIVYSPLLLLLYPPTYRQIFPCSISLDSTCTCTSVTFHEHVFTPSGLAPLGFVTRYDTDSASDSARYCI
jgi:hypothetical protein